MGEKETALSQNAEREREVENQANNTVIIVTDNSLMDAKISGRNFEEKQEICIISKYLFHAVY